MIFFSKTLNPNKQLVLNVYPYYSTTLLYFSSLKQCSPEKIIIKNFFSIDNAVKFHLFSLSFTSSSSTDHDQPFLCFSIDPFKLLFCFNSNAAKKTTAQKPDSHYCHCTLFRIYLPPPSVLPKTSFEKFMTCC